MVPQKDLAVEVPEGRLLGLLAALEQVAAQVVAAVEPGLPLLCPLCHLVALAALGRAPCGALYRQLAEAGPVALLAVEPALMAVSLSLAVSLALWSAGLAVVAAAQQLRERQAAMAVEGLLWDFRAVLATEPAAVAAQHP